MVFTFQVFQGNLRWEIIFPSADSALELRENCSLWSPHANAWPHALHKQPLVIYQQEQLRIEGIEGGQHGGSLGPAASYTFSHTLFHQHH